MKIKAKIWDKVDGRWLDPALFVIDAEHGEVMELCPAENRYFSPGHEVVLVLFTGLTDKNGKEIYEGDIVKDAKGGIAEICWIDIDACFAVQTGKKNIFTVSAHKERYGKLEVIGTIYENPELLEAPNDPR